jgi:hypothetical protein
MNHQLESKQISNRTVECGAGVWSQISDMYLAPRTPKFNQRGS